MAYVVRQSDNSFRMMVTLKSKQRISATLNVNSKEEADFAAETIEPIIKAKENSLPLDELKQFMKSRCNLYNKDKNALLQNTESRGESHSIKFIELVQRWRNEVVENSNKGLAKSTQNRNYNRLEHEALSLINYKRIDEISRQDIEALLAKIKEVGQRGYGKVGRPVSNTTLEHYYVLINSIFNYAMKWDLIDKNPCRNIEKPRREKKKIAFKSLTEQVDSIVDCINAADGEDNFKFKVALTIILFSGCRRSEVLGLCFNNVDFKECKIYIEKGATKVPGDIVRFSKTKTALSTRSVVVPQSVIDLIKCYKEKEKVRRIELGRGWHEEDAMFLATKNVGRFKIYHDGSVSDVLNPDVLSDKFKKIISDAENIGGLSIHKMRHLHISLLLKNGVPMLAVSQRAGHSNIATTVDVYGHIDDESDRRSSEIFERALSRAEMI